jgi:hypothetical protein
MTYLQNNAALVQQRNGRADGDIKCARKTVNSATAQLGAPRKGMDF